MSRPLIISSLLGLALLAACQPNSTVLPGAPAAAVPVATPSPPSTTKTFEQAAVLFRNAEYDSFEVYESSALHVVSGEENNTPDFGHLQFQAISGASKDDDGFFVTVRKAQSTDGLVQLGTIDKGRIDPTTIKEAPEGGYSSATVGKRNRVSIESGNVYLLRLKQNDGMTYYCRLHVRDIEPTKISYTLVTQTEAGNRGF